MKRMTPKISPCSSPRLAALVGMPADIAPSAYQYRADRKPEENPPESWLALMRSAGLPFNKPVDINAPAIKQALCGLLWEEIRPVQRLELIWPADSKRQPSPEELTITVLNNDGASSSWWNNLLAAKKEVKPSVSGDGKTYAYKIEASTCGIVVRVAGKNAADYDTPAARALVAETWKKMDLEIEWGFDPNTAGKDYSGRIETYDGIASGLRPLDGAAGTSVKDDCAWRSPGKASARRGIKLSLLYLGTAQWRRFQPFTSQRDDVARTIVTLWTKAGNFSFLAADLEHGPILAPEYGFFVRRTSDLRVPLPPVAWTSRAASAREFVQELRARELKTIRRQIRDREEQTWEGAVAGMRGVKLPPHPKPPSGSEPPMQVQVPCERLTAQWNLGAWHLLRHCEKNPHNGRLLFDDYPYPLIATESYLILAVLDLMGAHKEVEDGFDQFLQLPVDRKTPSGNFSDGTGCLTGAGKNPAYDSAHMFGPGSIAWALTEHYWLTGDKEWLKAAAPRIKANAEWMLRQRQLLPSLVPGGERLWCRGLQPALQVTPDSGGLWMQFYECEAYYWASVSRFAATLAEIDPAAGAKLMAEAEAYRQDLLAAVERSIALSPVVQTRDGAFHSVIPFACYVRGLGTGAWGWLRDGSGAHVGPLYWETVQSAAALISPAELLSANDVRVQGWLDVLEDRLLLENQNVGDRDWFLAGWQYQGGLERTPNMHLAGDDIPVFLRSFLNCYAIDILPNDGYIFNEHAVHGPPDKIFEEAAFLERFRNLLVTEDGANLWLARATPRAWLEQGRKISVKNAPTHFGPVDYEIVSDADHGQIIATIKMPARQAPETVILRLRHPKSAPIQRVTVNGKAWKNFDPAGETIRLTGVTGKVAVRVNY